MSLHGNEDLRTNPGTKAFCAFIVPFIEYLLGQVVVIGEFPVDKVPPSFNVLSTVLASVLQRLVKKKWPGGTHNVIGVFPHVTNKDWFLSGNQRALGVGSWDDLELSVFVFY